MLRKAALAASLFSKHKSVAGLVTSARDPDPEFAPAAARYHAYVRGVQRLREHLLAYRTEVYGSLLRLGEAVGELQGVEELGDDAANGGGPAARLRLGSEKLKHTCKATLCGPLETVLLALLEDEIGHFPAVAALLAAREEALHESQHYVEKVGKLEAQHSSNPEQSSTPTKLEAQLGRNGAKAAQAAAALDRATEAARAALDAREAVRKVVVGQRGPALAAAQASAFAALHATLQGLSGIGDEEAAALATAVTFPASADNPCVGRRAHHTTLLHSTPHHNYRPLSGTRLPRTPASSAASAGRPP